MDIRVDSSAFPLVVATYPADVDEEDIDTFFDRLSELAERGRFVLVSDGSQLALSRVNAASRVYLAKLSSQWDEGKGRGALLGLGVVMRGSLGKMMMTGYMWMKTPAPYPTELFTDVQNACAWGREQIETERSA